MEKRRYSDALEVDGLFFEISFDGAAESGKNPEHTNVALRCFNKHGQDIWIRMFGDIPMPEGAWHGFKLICAHKGRVFVAVSNFLIEINTESGASISEIETGNTTICAILMIGDSQQVIVFNDYYKFRHPKDLSNIAAYNFDGGECWRAKLGDGDVFANAPSFGKDGKLFASTWNCFKCEIDKTNGKILSREFTK